MDKFSPLKLFDENKTISGFNLRKLLFQQDQHEYVRSLVDKIFELWRKKQIQPIIDSCWAFEDIPDAMQKMHDRRNVGKITIDPAMEPKPKPVEEELNKKRRSFIKTTSDEVREAFSSKAKDDAVASATASSVVAGAPKQTDK